MKVKDKTKRVFIKVTAWIGGVILLLAVNHMVWGGFYPFQTLSLVIGLCCSAFVAARRGSKKL
jgi:hypothetical protein